MRAGMTTSYERFGSYDLGLPSKQIERGRRDQRVDPNRFVSIDPARTCARCRPRLVAMGDETDRGVQTEHAQNALGCLERREARS